MQAVSLVLASMLSASSSELLTCLGRPSGWDRPYGNVAISASGAESCKSQCATGGYLFWGLECPMGNDVHCQCSNALGGDEVLDASYCAGNGDGNGNLYYPHYHCVGPYEADGYLFGDGYVGSVYSTEDTDACECTFTGWEHYAEGFGNTGAAYAVNAVGSWVNVQADTISSLRVEGACSLTVAKENDGASALSTVFTEGIYNYPLSTGNDNINSVKLECVETADVTVLELSETFVATKGNSIGSIPIYDNMRFELDFTLRSFPASTWENVFHCGASDKQRMTGVWVRPSSASGDGFHTKFSTAASWNNGPDVGGSLSLNTPYHFVVDVTQSAWSITINEQVLYEEAKTAHTLYDSIPCYAADPWYGAADIEFSNILITSPDAVAEATTTTMSPCDNAQCEDPFVCDADADQFATVSDAQYPCKRDCDLFAVDEYLDQCSAIFPAAIEAVTASIDRVVENVLQISSVDIPAVTARVQLNEDAVTSIHSELGSVETRIEALTDADAATDSRVTLNENAVTAIHSELSSVGTSIEALNEVDIATDARIAGVTALAEGNEANVGSLEERLTILERRIAGFEASDGSAAAAAAKSGDGQLDVGGELFGSTATAQLPYTDALIGALVAANLIIMACFVYYALTKRCNAKHKYASVVGDSESENLNI